MKLCIFTLVLDGMPFIPAQFFTLSRLSFNIDWHWYIVHGAAANTGSTNWCQRQEPRLSKDGTTEFLNALKGHPRITIIESKWFPGGKDEMVNAALEKIKGPCALVQMDCDEMWETWQIERIHHMFETDPVGDYMLFDCVFYVGLNIVTTMRGAYGQNWGEWKRAFRFTPGQKMRHEPPMLTGESPKGWQNEATLAAGLCFHHFSYCFEHQVAYKAAFYNYPSAVEGWKRLQENTVWPVKHLKDFLPWVDEYAGADLLNKPSV